jgi:hypothetical protein
MLGERDAISELGIIQKKYWIKLFDENEKKTWKKKQNLEKVSKMLGSFFR